MGAIRGVLEEEFERLKELSKKYKEMIASLPKGSISIKERRGHPYAYLAFREKGKVRFEYLGKAPSARVKELEKEIESRRRYESLLRKVEKDRKEVERAIHGRKK